MTAEERARRLLISYVSAETAEELIGEIFHPAPIRVTHVLYTEGGTWVELPAPPQMRRHYIHAFRVEGGMEWDAINGWRRF